MQEVRLRTVKGEGNMTTFRTLAELIEENRQLSAIVGRLQELHGCSTEMVVPWSERAEHMVARLDKENRELRKHADALAEAVDRQLRDRDAESSDALDTVWLDYARWKSIKRAKENQPT